MGKIYLSSKDIEKIKQGEFLGDGEYAKVYDYNGKAIKIYDNDLEPKAIRSIERMSKYNDDIFVFPDDIVYVDDKIKAYTQEKVDGITLYHMIIAVLQNYYDIDIELFMEDYQKLKKTIKRISDEHIIVYDLHDENIMFNKGFKVIDTANYKIDYFRSKDDIYKSNMINFADLFVSEFIKLNSFSVDIVQEEIGNKYSVNYMDNFLKTIPKKLEYCKSLRDFKDYNTL